MTTTEQELKRLLNLIGEKRSDIADVLEAIIEGYEWSDDQIEHRFVCAKLPNGTFLEYDTLTTEIRYSDDNVTWHRALDHEYID